MHHCLEIRGAWFCLFPIVIDQFMYFGFILAPLQSAVLFCLGLL